MFRPSGPLSFLAGCVLFATLGATAATATVLSSLVDPPAPALEAALDVVAARIEQDGPRLTFVIETRGDVPPAPPAPADAWVFLWLLDTDRDAGTGQPHGDLGSEFNVRAVVGAGGGGFVDVNGPGPGGGDGVVTVDGATVRVTIWLWELGGATEFDWRCGTFAVVGESVVGGDAESAIAYADPAEVTAPALVLVTTPILQLCPTGTATGRLTMEIRDATGAIVPNEGHVFAFHSTNEAVATVDSTGLVTAVTPPQYHWQRPYIEAWADGVMAQNAAVARVTATDFGLAHQEYAAAHVTLSLVPVIEGVNLDSLTTHFQVLEALERAWLEQAALTSGVPVLPERQYVVLDVADTPEASVCGASGNPLCVGWLWGRPQHNSCYIINDPADRVPQWFVLFHELGHNLASTCNSFNMFLWQPSAPHNTAYAEGLATLAAMYAWQAIVAEPGALGPVAVASLREQFTNGAAGYRSALATWRAAGADYDQLDPDIVDGILLELLDDYGDAPWYGLFSSFLPSPEPLPLALDTREKQATWFVAALSAACGTDLRGRFRTRYGFPLDDEAWPAIVAAVTPRVAARAWTPLAVGDPPAGGVALAGAPNPFRPSTTLRFTLAAAGEVRLTVHDVSGRRVRTLRDGWLPAGAHARAWDGRDDGGRRLAPGVYVVRLQTPGGTSARKLTLLD